MGKCYNSCFDKYEKYNNKVLFDAFIVSGK